MNFHHIYFIRNADSWTHNIYTSFHFSYLFVVALLLAVPAERDSRLQKNWKKTPLILRQSCDETVRIPKWQCISTRLAPKSARKKRDDWGQWPFSCDARLEPKLIISVLAVRLIWMLFCDNIDCSPRSVAANGFEFFFPRCVRFSVAHETMFVMCLFSVMHSLHAHRFRKVGWVGGRFIRICPLLSVDWIASNMQ